MARNNFLEGIRAGLQSYMQARKMREEQQHTALQEQYQQMQMRALQENQQNKETPEQKLTHEKSKMDYADTLRGKREAAAAQRKSSEEMANRETSRQSAQEWNRNPSMTKGGTWVPDLSGKSPNPRFVRFPASADENASASAKLKAKEEAKGGQTMSSLGVTNPEGFKNLPDSQKQWWAKKALGPNTNLQTDDYGTPIVKYQKPQQEKANMGIYKTQFNTSLEGLASYIPGLDLKNVPKEMQNSMIDRLSSGTAAARDDVEAELYAHAAVQGLPIPNTDRIKIMGAVKSWKLKGTPLFSGGQVPPDLDGVKQQIATQYGFQLPKVQ